MITNFDWQNARAYHNSEKPDWWTGKAALGMVGDHILTVCKRLGLTEMPQGYIVHHCNGNKRDNRFSNLVLMSRADHLVLHFRYLKDTRRPSKEAVLKWIDGRREGATEDMLREILAEGCVRP